MNILVINAGSSSLKYQLFNMQTREVLAKGLCERIGIDGRIKHTASGREEYIKDILMADHASAIRVVTELLIGRETGVLNSMQEINAVGHRVVHGGEFFSHSVFIDETVLKAIEQCVPLAPLHNPPNLVGIKACQAVMGDIPQVAVFDTAVHQSIPKKAYLYALPYEYYEKYKIRRYGFHGTSVRFVSQRAAELLGKPLDSLKLIVCHMGNGTSVTAMNMGQSFDTSMGFTPLEGVPMGTRSGNIDPTILEFVMQHEGISISDMLSVLNKKSGVLGISGVSSDFRDLHDAAEQGNERARAALEVFAHSVRKTIGGYAAIMGGCDAIVFTAGIGENNCEMREWICRDLGFMGFDFDPSKNNVRCEAFISAKFSRGKLMVVPTNEELVIARDTEVIVTARIKDAFSERRQLDGQPIHPITGGLFRDDL